jgi:hypothetical protein
MFPIGVAIIVSFPRGGAAFKTLVAWQKEKIAFFIILLSLKTSWQIFSFSFICELSL